MNLNPFAAPAPAPAPVPPNPPPTAPLEEPGAEPALAVIAFARNPGQAKLGGLNLEDKDDRKYFNMASRSLYVADELFDCKREGLHGFTQVVLARAQEYRWDQPGGILHIANDLQNPTRITNLLTNYGEVSMGQILASERAHMRTNVRKSQDSSMLYELLKNSISKDGMRPLWLRKDEWILYFPGDTRAYHSGPLLFKIIISVSFIDTNATATSIRNQLLDLPTYILEIGSDITKFNQHVALLLENLASRGQTASDIIVNLFKAYKTAGDTKFVKYIEDREAEHDDGKGMDYRELMLYADNKYKVLIDKKEWQAQSPEQKGIVALESKLSKLENKMVKFKTAPGKEKDKDKKPGHGNGKGEKPTWLAKNIAPKDPKPNDTPRKWKNKDWHWCSPATGGKCEGNWRVHKPSDCQGTAKSKASAGVKRKSKGTPQERKLKLKAAYAAVREEARALDIDLDDDDSVTYE